MATIGQVRYCINLSPAVESVGSLTDRNELLLYQAFYKYETSRMVKQEESLKNEELSSTERLLQMSRALATTCYNCWMNMNQEVHMSYEIKPYMKQRKLVECIQSR
ncbi:unnamed protein product [Albugo candida]|uniref:Uncharacterized protein n=1 Tax=Albugo candida TaxID=65357 RepID=A0A024GG54_9STRA|nr:unnamed protein product [Albugo candida]|eukprot:CCI45852.1 unnamed protein product [Albugo candida]